MTDLRVIETNVKSILEQVAAFKKVYDQEPKNLVQLPATSLFFDGFKQRDESTRRKYVDWRWILRIYVQLNDAEKAQTELKQLILDSLDKLRQNPSLNSTCLYHTITNGEIFVLTDQNNPQLMAELHLEATTQENY
ncbi:hypothetical protein [Tepidibacillus decaturensis]|uniref:Uncharacterized protein n=1 Tax=Tepidibacillus decaturensis TaxID=1413211 RepID=A0A135L1L3_9BACI|nr:hypothetical protein [Tepidibacillus decaturensis]KXG42875.1 hypothetical protein U473_01645 [Tepidibacillus decaturensis]